MISVWGVDHGPEVVSKADKQKVHMTAGQNIGVHGLGGYYGAYKAKPGRKVATGLRMAGRSAAESAGGAAVGTGLGAGVAAAATRGRRTGLGAGIGYYAGGAAGGHHGVRAAYKNARRRGDIPSS